MRLALDMCIALDMPCGARGIDIISNRLSDISILRSKNIEPRKRHIDNLQKLSTIAPVARSALSEAKKCPWGASLTLLYAPLFFNCLQIHPAFSASVQFIVVKSQYAMRKEGEAFGLSIPL